MLKFNPCGTSVGHRQKDRTLCCGFDSSTVYWVDIFHMNLLQKNAQFCLKQHSLFSHFSAGSDIRTNFFKFLENRDFLQKKFYNIDHRKEHFTKMNGFANSFYGWGGEDDDLYHRMEKHNLTLFRSPASISRFYMQVHEQVSQPTAGIGGRKYFNHSRLGS